MITAPMLEEQVLASLDGVTELILDFKDLMYISSAGIRVLLTAQEALGKQGEMKLIQVNEMIRGILEMTGITSLMPVE
jgi:anti-sigma B factor antagonist